MSTPSEADSKPLHQVVAVWETHPLLAEMYVVPSDSPGHLSRDENAAREGSTCSLSGGETFQPTCFIQLLNRVKLWEKFFCARLRSSVRGF